MAVAGATDALPKAGNKPLPRWVAPAYGSVTTNNPVSDAAHTVPIRQSRVQVAEDGEEAVDSTE